MKQEPETTGVASGSRRGVAGILLAALLFSVMAAGAKFASLQGVPYGEVTFFRFTTGFVVLAALARMRVIEFCPGNFPWLFLRGLAGGLAICCYFFALSGGALTNAVVLNASYPIFVALFSAAFIGERVRGFVYPILVVAFAGILLVIRPTPQHVNTADIFGLASGVLAAIGILTLRKLRETENVWTILTFLNGVGMLIAAPFFFARPVCPTPLGWAALITVSLASNFAQVSLTYAYKYMRASEGSILIKVSVVISAFVGYFVFGDRIDLPLVVGAVLILGSGAVLTALIHRAEANPHTSQIRTNK